MLAEKEKSASYSRGMRRGIRAAKTRARKTGEIYVPPPRPEYLTPEQRLDFERFLVPKIKDMLNADRLLLPDNRSIIEDYIATRERVRNGTETSDWIEKFDQRHPNIQDISKPDNLGTVLIPVFQLINGRYTQTANTRAQMRR